jgi:UDP-N-acetylglucosamine--N-acetylmuramyl-(pentapeptide) pyrophosphoryl-undecaprenol N-acetylglucosamine transferase
MPARKILIAAGGTGGHIYPALAVAHSLKKLQPGTEIEFVGTRLGLENKIIPPQGFKVNHLPIGRLNSNVSARERLTTLLLLPLAFIKSFLVLRKFKPDLVLGVGGHASGPLLLVAAVFGYRTAIWEPNAMPGMANRILSRFVNEAFVVFDDAKSHLRARHISDSGMPVRAEIEAMEKVNSSGDGKFNILVFGGSQGSKGLNNTVVEMVRENPEWAKGIFLVHQTGAVDYGRVKELYGQLLNSGQIELHDYLHDMGTVSELAACGRPAILIPLPTAADDHQTKNAESLAKRGGAVLLPQKGLTAEKLKATIEELRTQPERLRNMSLAIQKFHQPQAADTLARSFLERIEQNAPS